MMPALAVYFGLILARVATFVAVMPLFAGRTPRSVRAALALALAVFYVGGVAPGWDPALANQAAQVDSVVYALALVREALLGAAMGFAFSLFLLPARIAGEFVTQQIGLAISPQAGPAGTDAAGPIAIAFETIASLIFLLLDGHHVALAVLHASFDRLPLGGPFVPAPVGQMITGLTTAQQMGVLLAGPLALCLMLLTVLLAIMARAAPQLNIYSVGFALQVLVALFGALFLMPELVRTIVLIIGRTGDSLTRLLW